MPQLDIPAYPIFLIVADVGLTGVLLLTVPVLGKLMAIVALFVVTTVAFRVPHIVSFGPHSEAPQPEDSVCDTDASSNSV